MNIDHLNFVVEARYYGYWIALVFAIVCLLMFVYVKILDAREKKKRIHAEKNITMNLTKELVRKISGFFMLEENCRGYDPNTPIGEIVEHAFQHWQRHAQEVYELKRLNRRNAELLELEKEKVADARKIACDFQNVICDIEKKLRHHKYKRCLDKAEWCRLEQERIELIENQDITDDDFNKLVKGFYKKWRQRWLNIAEKFKE